MGFVRGDSQDQGALFPVSLDELVPEDHVCRVIDAFVGSLDLLQLGFSKAQPAATGRPANRAVNKQGEGTFFDRTSFVYDEASDTMRCPAGKTLQRKQLQRGKHRVLYAAEPRDCAACPLKARCTQQSRRLVTRHLYEAALQRMHDRATPWAMRLRRCTVEHPFAGLKYRIFEKPRFLLRGRWGAGTEMSLATLVWNLKRAMAVVGSVALTERLARA